jgi:hypothetical protein
MTDHDLIANLHRRMDTQDKLLLDIRDAQIKHVTVFEEMKPQIDELITLWRGSKIIIPAMAAIATAAAVSFDWLRLHIK